MWEKIATHTKDDEELKDVLNAVHFGWESDHAQSLKPYYHFRGDITEIDGVLVKGPKVIIPKTLQGDMLKKIHEGHLGIEKCQARARQVMYWPNINNDIENHIGRCGTCQKHRYKQAKEPMEQHEIPEKPWRKIGADLFTLFGKNFLVVVDYTSNYTEVAKLEDLSSTNTLSHMKSIMARHGLPSVVVSDNGPQFSSLEFRQFAMQYGFKHVTSSPEYPQSNGKAEKAVQIVKRLLKKAKENYEDPYLALLNYRISPLSGSDRSPGEISMNRKLRTKLPSAEEHVTMHKLPDIKQKRYYDHGSNQLKPLETTDTVRVRGDGVWSEKAQVLARVAPNSYLVELERGKGFTKKQTSSAKDTRESRVRSSTTEPLRSTRHTSKRHYDHVSRHVHQPTLLYCCKLSTQKHGFRQFFAFDFVKNDEIERIAPACLAEWTLTSNALKTERTNIIQQADRIQEEKRMTRKLRSLRKQLATVTFRNL
ncbi:hypothetical protein NP493_1967g00005 [Ridgeia piscesae]|uniref:Integrase catalytic domain-containing protein n=1 Tax=Ridgeia piscesae TaxID=27915 RepID=A0AAD9JNK0_RIDPI|nr:hypothetical protein NP493_1967g00005 [Ridgeia piscesae]